MKRRRPSCRSCWRAARRLARRVGHAADDWTQKRLHLALHARHLAGWKQGVRGTAALEDR